MMGIGRILTIIALGVMFWSFGITPPSTLATNGQKVAINYQTGEQVEIQPLDDTGNPYRGEYAEWDIWAYENYSWDYSWVERGQWEKPTVQHLDNWYGMAPRVDENGYMLPDILWRKMSHNQRYGRTLQEIAKHEKRSSLGLYAFMAEGVMEENLWAEYGSATERVRAGCYPIIPNWLVSMHSMQCQAAYPLEDGSWVVEVLEAELGYIEHYLYDQDGSLLPSPHKRSGTAWQDILWDYFSIHDLSCFQTQLEMFPNGETYGQANVSEVSGYTVLYDFETENILAVYDYDGDRLYDESQDIIAQGCQLKVRPIRYGERIGRYNLEKLYAIQTTSD